MKLMPLTEPPKVGDIVYHDNLGLVKYRVNEHYRPQAYPEVVTLTVVEDFGGGYFKPGHGSVRYIEDLLVEGD